jgi:hypothetical protein
MLFAARFSKEPKTNIYEHVLYTINYGEFICGRRGWSSRLKIGEQKLRTLIKKLEKDAMIQTVYIFPHRFTIYKIVNYEKYNLPSNPPQTLVAEEVSLGANPPSNPPVTHWQPTGNPLATTKEERKKEKKVKNDQDMGFTEFWDCYPRKVSKKNAQSAWAKIRPDKDLLQKMITAIKDQKTSPQWTRDNGDSIPHPATWLNGERWNDETQRIGSSGVDHAIHFDPGELEIRKEREQNERPTSSPGQSGS